MGVAAWVGGGALRFFYNSNILIMKRLIIIIVLTILRFHLSAQTNKTTVANIIYADGKQSLVKLNLQLDDLEHLKILFDSVKVQFAKRFHLIFPILKYPDKIPFKFKNDGCKIIADNFMEFSGGYKFEDSNDLKRVPFGKGYVCSYVILNMLPIKTDSFQFNYHRVVKFKLKNDREYVFDMVISQNEPIELQKWLSIYRKISNDSTLKYTELTLVGSINNDDYSESLASVVKGMNIFRKKNMEFSIFFKGQSVIKNNPHQIQTMNKANSKSFIKNKTKNKWQSSSKKGL